MSGTEPDSRVRRVLAFVAAFEPGYKAGGPIKSMVQILDNLPASVEVTLITADRDLGDSMPYPGLSGRSVQRGQHEVYYLNWRDPRQWGALCRRLRRTSYDLLYVNSLWSPQFTVLPIVAHRLSLVAAREVLLSPRGELSPGALGFKSTKKQAFLRVWGPLLRGMDPLWCASAEMEVEDIHAVFPWARTIVQRDGQGDEPRSEVAASSPNVRFLFVSRISEKKNLRLALEAFQLVKSEVDFDIYGPLEDTHYWTACQGLIARLPHNVRAVYRGELRPDQVRETFAQYDGFIFPTLGENFGHVICESLSAGCPVVCSQETPWTAVLRNGGGSTLAELDARLWAAEIDRRAKQTSIERDEAKRAALFAYARWHRADPHPMAVERALDTLPREVCRAHTKRPHRIALVTQGYQTAGGVQTVARWLVKGLRGAGHEVVVFDLARSRADPNSRRVTAPRTWLRNTLMEADPAEAQVVHVGANGVELEPMRYLPRKAFSVELDRFDVVQVVAGGPALALTTVRSRRPTVLQVATTVARERSSQLAVAAKNLARWRRAMTWATSIMERAALRRVDTVMVENCEMEQFVSSVCQTRVVMAPPGVDTDRFTPHPEGWDRQGYLLSVCRLEDPRKGLDRLVRAYALMTAQRRALPRLILAGRGTLPASLVRLIEDLDLVDRVDVRSDVPSPDLPALFRGASVYLQTSYEEGLGISVLEAMASGLPVVSTETAGTRETVAHGLTGWLVGQDSDVETTVAARAISVLDFDGHAMSISARSRADSRFCGHVALSRFLEVYDQLLGVRP